MRHGEAVDDIEDCYGGIADFELTDLGRKQASTVGSELKQHKPNVIYSSPLKRAKETANIISQDLNVTVETIETLHERNSYGVLSGLNKDVAKKLFPAVFNALTEKPGYSDEPIPGYEPWEEFVIRVANTLQIIVTDALKNKYDVIGIVTHGKFTKAAFDNVLSIEQEYDLKLSALNIVQHEPSTSKLI